MSMSEEITGLPYSERPELQLVGIDGNAFAIMGAVSDALRRAGKSEARQAFLKEATAGDYDHLLRVCMSYVKAPPANDDDDYEEDSACARCGAEVDDSE